MNFSTLVIKLLLLLFLSSHFISFQTPIDSIPLDFHTPTLSHSLDFGRIKHHYPSFVLKPKNPKEISLLLKSICSSSIYNNLTVAARGAGHSTHGQAQAPHGIVVDMASLPRSIEIKKFRGGENEKDYFFAVVDGGALWIQVLEETLKHGLAPRSWTDYLYLTVGGTLSVGGISGQTFKYGPQISNVLEMDVVTGKGEIVSCSEKENLDLFYGALGGLGQFGIITSAKLILEVAPKMVKWIKVVYDDFNKFIEDEVLLISMEKVDYVEGFVNLQNKPFACSWRCMPSSPMSLDEENNSGRTNTYYYIEIAIYYDDSEAIQETSDQILSRLSFIPSMLHSRDVSYFDFLNRVRSYELNLRSQGLGEVPHPWLNLFVPRFYIKQFKDLLIDTISVTPIDGPILIYPMLSHKWNRKMSSILPQEDTEDDIFFKVGILRSAIPSSNNLQTLLDQNQKIINIATSKLKKSGIKNTISNMMNDTMGTMYGGVCTKEGGRELVDMMDGRDGMEAKQYMPHYMDEGEWRVHFGEKWERFKELKSKFDPLNILSPGQMIFKRKSIDG